MTFRDAAQKESFDLPGCRVTSVPHPGRFAPAQIPGRGALRTPGGRKGARGRSRYYQETALGAGNENAAWVKIIGNLGLRKSPGPGQDTGPAAPGRLRRPAKAA